MKLNELKLEVDYFEFDEKYYHKVNPTPLKNPKGRAKTIANKDTNSDPTIALNIPSNTLCFPKIASKIGTLSKIISKEKLLKPL